MKNFLPMLLGMFLGICTLGCSSHAQESNTFLNPQLISGYTSITLLDLFVVAISARTANTPKGIYDEAERLMLERQRRHQF